LDLARERVRAADWPAAAAQIREAFACSSAWPVWRTLLELPASSRTSQARG